MVYFTKLVDIYVLRLLLIPMWHVDHLTRDLLHDILYFLVEIFSIGKVRTNSGCTAEAEYRAMTHTTCEIAWVCSFLEEMGFNVHLPRNLACDNQAPIHIAAHPVFHE